MSERNTVVRSLHDLGLAAWFGGSLAGAVAVNGAAADVSDTLRLRVANAGWARWTPVNAAAIAAHLIGGARLLQANRGRAATRGGVGASTVAKLGADRRGAHVRDLGQAPGLAACRRLSSLR